MTTQRNVVVVTGTSRGFGDLTARALAEAGHIVYAPHGERPFRRHVGPGREGSEVTPVLHDRIGAEFCHRIGIDELLNPHAGL